MTAIITGATGCLGLNLTKRLVFEGHDVIALGRNEQLGKIVSQSGAKFVNVDLRDEAALKRIFHDADFIFHCAALSSPWGSYRDFYQSNVIGTQHVIAATPEKARLIHVSSPSIYFDYTEKFDIKENSPLPQKPANYYVKTKRLAEKLIDKAHLENKLNVITIRPRAIFGPYDRSIIPRLLGAEKNGVLPIIGTGENLIDITCVDNVVESLILASKVDNIYCGNKYNITNDDPQTFITLISMIYDALKKPLKTKRIPRPLANALAYGMETIYRVLPLSGEPPLTQYSVGVLSLGQTLNIEAAKRDLKYKPTISIADGIQQFAKWYLSI